MRAVLSDRRVSSWLRLSLTFLFFALPAFLLFRGTKGAWVVIRPTSDGFAGAAAERIRAASPLALLFLLTFFAGCSALRSGALTVCCLWRGASFGCTAAAFLDGRLAGTSPCSALLLCLVLDALWLAAASAADIIGPELLRASGGGNDARRSLSELCRGVLIPAGAALLLAVLRPFLP